MNRLQLQLWRIRNALRWSFIKSTFEVELAKVFTKMTSGNTAFIGELRATVIRANGTREELGTVSRRVVTTAFVNLLVDDLQSSQAAFHSMKYHGMGTDNDPGEAVGDTALNAEVETRGTGTQAEGASANIYKSVGTVAATASRSIVEHGLFSAAAAGTMLDRSVFTVISLLSGDSIEFTYQLTCTAGG